MITENSKLTFGKYFGTPLKDCPLHYLNWLYENIDGKREEWGLVAGKIYRRLKAEKEASDALEREADRILKDNGYKA